MSLVTCPVVFLHRPVMLYGFRDPSTRSFRKYTRISSNVSILHRAGLSIGNHVWIWHNTILDASGGLKIGEGCQIGAHVGLFTHSSHNSIRYLGRSFADTPAEERYGYVRKPICIGRFTFISSGTIVLPGISIGDGCVIGPNCVINRDIPDHAIVASTPPRIIGSTRDSDCDVLQRLEIRRKYYDQPFAASFTPGAL